MISTNAIWSRAPYFSELKTSRVHHLRHFAAYWIRIAARILLSGSLSSQEIFLDNLGLWKEFLHITFTQKAHVAKVGPVARVSPEEDKPGRNRQKLSK